MKIAVSACLLGENCKYNGGNNYRVKLARLLEGHEVLRVCPETSGGLTTPREPCEIVNGVVYNKLGVNVDEAFRKGAQKALEEVLRFGAELVILQSRSPSCGVGRVYDGTFTGKLVPGDGVFAALLKSAGVNVTDDVEFEERLP